MKSHSHILILIILTGCLSFESKAQMNESKFTRAYLKVLKSKYPDVNYKILENLKIEAEKNGSTVTHFLDNSYNSYVQEPSGLNEILETYAKSAGDLYEANEKLDTTRIVPIIKDIQYLEGVERLTTDGNNEIGLVYEKLNDGLLVVFAEDTENSISYFDKEKLSKTSLTGDLFSLALENLENILPDIQKHGDNPLFMLTAGGDYEASLILLDFIWTKENFPVDGEIVIAVPSRDLLLITGSESPDGLKKMKQLADETIKKGSYTLTSTFFIRSEGKWEKFDY